MARGRGLTLQPMERKWIEQVKALERRVDVRMNGLASQIRDIRLQVVTLLEIVGKVQSALGVEIEQLTTKPADQVAEATPEVEHALLANLASSAKQPCTDPVATAMHQQDSAAEQPCTDPVCTASSAAESAQAGAIDEIDGQSDGDSDVAHALLADLTQAMPDIAVESEPLSAERQQSDGDSEAKPDIAVESELLSAERRQADGNSEAMPEIVVESEPLSPDRQQSDGDSDVADALLADLSQAMPDMAVESEPLSAERQQGGDADVSDAESEVADALLADLLSGAELPDKLDDSQPEASAAPVLVNTETAGQPLGIQAASAVDAAPAVTAAPAASSGSTAPSVAGDSNHTAPSEDTGFHETAVSTGTAPSQITSFQITNFQETAALNTTSSAVEDFKEICTALKSSEVAQEKETTTKRPLSDGAVSSSKRKKMDWYKQKYADVKDTALDVRSQQSLAQSSQRPGRPGGAQRRNRKAVHDDSFPPLPGTRRKPPRGGLDQMIFPGKLPLVDAILPPLPQLNV